MIEVEGVTVVAFKVCKMHGEYWLLLKVKISYP